MGERYPPASDNLLQADRDLYQALVAERSMLADSLTAAQLDALDESRKENAARAADRIKAFVRLIQDPRADERAAKHERLRDEWLASAARVVELRRNGALAAAQSLSLGRAADQFDAMRAVIDDLTEYKIEKSNEAAQEIAATASRGFWLLVLVSAGGLLICMFFAITIPLFVQRTLGRLVSRMEAISSGDGISEPGWTSPTTTSSANWPPPSTRSSPISSN